MMETHETEQGVIEFCPGNNFGSEKFGNSIPCMKFRSMTIMNLVTLFNEIEQGSECLLNRLFEIWTTDLNRSI